MKVKEYIPQKYAPHYSTLGKQIDPKSLALERYQDADEDGLRNHRGPLFTAMVCGELSRRPFYWAELEAENEDEAALLVALVLGAQQ
jgi:hypothetical protein